MRNNFNCRINGLKVVGNLKNGGSQQLFILTDKFSQVLWNCEKNLGQ